jgi:hypothetical protein
MTALAPSHKGNLLAEYDRAGAPTARCSTAEVQVCRRENATLALTPPTAAANGT